MKAHTNTCAVCARPIGLSFLMCNPHWHQVPVDLSREVYATWGRVCRKSPDPREQLQRVLAHRKAADAAVAHVKALIATTEGAST